MPQLAPLSAGLPGLKEMTPSFKVLPGDSTRFLKSNFHTVELQKIYKLNFSVNVRFGLPPPPPSANTVCPQCWTPPSTTLRVEDREAGQRFGPVRRTHPEGLDQRDAVTLAVAGEEHFVPVTGRQAVSLGACAKKRP